MDLSQELGKDAYKNNPVKNWGLKEKNLPCENSDDYVRLVDDYFCCEPAKHRMANPLSNEPDYNNKLRQRKQDYLDLFERKLTIPITEKLYEELISDEAPERIGIIQESSLDKGRAKAKEDNNSNFSDYFFNNFYN